MEVSEDTKIGGTKWRDLRGGEETIQPMNLSYEDNRLYEGMMKAYSELEPDEEFGYRTIKIQ